MMHSYRRMMSIAGTVAVTLLLARHGVVAQAPVGDSLFSDAVGRSVTVVFDTAKEVTLRGVVTAPLTYLRSDRRGAGYLSIEVGDEAGKRTTWAVFVRKAVDIPDLPLGTSLAVTGWVARDGSPRLESQPEKIRRVSR
jgi:hypothetical protein